jgi:hypothetical protein
VAEQNGLKAAQVDFGDILAGKSDPAAGVVVPL